MRRASLLASAVLAFHLIAMGTSSANAAVVSAATTISSLRGDHAPLTKFASEREFDRQMELLISEELGASMSGAAIFERITFLRIERVFAGGEQFASARDIRLGDLANRVGEDIGRVDGLASEVSANDLDALEQPIPGAFVLMIAGLFGLAVAGRRRRSAG
jgi:hypothetical protein